MFQSSRSARHADSGPPPTDVGPPATDVGTAARIPSSRRLKWVVLAFWIVVLALTFTPAGKLTSALNDEAASWLPANAQSTQVVKEIEAFQSKNEAPAVLVFDRPGGLTRADQTAVQALAADFKGLDHVTNVAGPIPSQDGQALQLIVGVDAGDGGWNQMVDVADAMKSAAASRPDGLTLHLTGPVGFAVDSASAFAGIDGKLLYSAATVVIIILLLTYRSPVLWLVPVICAATSLTVAQAVIYLLARDDTLTVNSQSSGILTVIVFGAATDYALLLVARYREELRRHEDRHEAMALALHRSGPAIIASGLTVIAGLLCLLFATMNSTKGMGPVAAIGIAVGLIVMLTLLPALLVVAGRWVFWPLVPHYGSTDRSTTGAWARIGSRIARAPRRTWVITSVILLAASVGVLQLNPTGLQNKDAFYNTPESVIGEQVVARHFPAGAGSPVMVLSNAAAAGGVAAAIQTDSGVASVAPPVTRGGRSLLMVTLTDAPDSPAATDTVDRLRADIATVPGADAIAGGDTAIRADTLRASRTDSLRIIPIILTVVFLILMLLLRALVAPVLLIATVVLSFAAASGLSALIFRHVLDFPGADPSLPLFAFVFLVARGIDYNIFLMTRVREESTRVGTRRGALIGLAATGGVITSAGLVLAGTFAVLATLPVVAFAEIGIIVALGVLLDTLVVRSVLVTALTLDLGGRMWWPSWLARRDGDLSQGTGAPTNSLVTHRSS
ncbi:MMPL family transporter [Kribbia dieselivorans]|uniref:MMPL family transporter n=1 Tax=Kribbia dieselivorans TaxID=331526 RepID=UPI0009F96903|nr:MMPL family transporter [Kribbia dieselivorans]